LFRYLSQLYMGKHTTQFIIHLMIIIKFTLGEFFTLKYMLCTTIFNIKMYR